LLISSTIMAGSVPQEAIAIVKEFEGCHRIDPKDGRVHAYPDPLTNAEPWTIGWGTTRYPDGRAVGKNDSITQDEADAYLAVNLDKNYWQPISKTIPHWAEMNDPMRSALCSFAYNLGVGFYGASGFNTISSCLREKRWADVPDALLLYVNPGSPVEAGLRRRRIAEGNLWDQGLDKLPLGDEAPAEKAIEAITETFLKKEKRDSTQLQPNQLVAVETGRRWKIESVLEKDGQSQKVRLAYGAGDWWIYSPHWHILDLPAEPPAPGPAPAPAPGKPSPPVAPTPAESTSRDLKVPYFSQLDNSYNPTGSCNVTCVAMCLCYLGLPRPSGSQLEDQLYRKLEELGRSRHNPYDLKYLIETYPGYKDIFRENGTFAGIKTSINAGNPVIIHGYFTRFGHIIVIRGYDSTGFLVNDPYGEWFSTGYDTSRSGERLHYSYDLIARTCSPESRSNPTNIWYHTVFKV
jgi:GH24 family phage-related lysozyme (muramidase)